MRDSDKEKPFAGYVRVSDFDAGAGHSPEWQEKIIRQAAKAKGDRVVFPVKPDLNVSGAVAADARALGTLLEGVEAGKYAGIYVWNIKRFGRDAADVLVNAKRMSDLGAPIIGAEDGVDTRQQGGKMLLGFMAVLGEDELDRITDVWDRASRGAIERGVHICSRVPFGYLKREDKRLAVDPERAPLVVETFKRRARGVSWGKLATWLDEVAPLATGKHWTRSRIAKMLTSRTYLGEARYGKLVNPDAHEAIVDENTFLAAQSSTASRHHPKTGKLSSQAALAGIVVCAGCGRKMQVGRQWSSGKATERAIYYCRSHSAAGRCPAPASLRVDTVDERVEYVLLEYLEGGGPITDSLRAATQVKSREADVAEARGVLDKLLTNTRLMATLGEDEYATAIESAKRDLENAKADLAEVRATADRIGGLDGNLLASWRSLGVTEKHGIFATLLDRVVLRKGAEKAPFRVQLVWRDNTVMTTAEDGSVYAPEPAALSK